MAATRTLETAKRTSWPLVISLDQLALWAVIGAALFFRVAGLDANFPGVTYGDETFFVRHSLAINWSDLNPHTFVWGTFHFYMLRATAAIADLVNTALTGHTLAFADYYLLARWLSLAAGIGTVIVLYRIGVILAGRRASLISAALFALSPFAVESAHYATVDSAMGFWVSLAALGMVEWIQGRRRGFWLAGLATGIAVATKYNAAVLVVPIILTALVLEHRGMDAPVARSRRWIIALVVCLAAFATLVAWLGRGQLLALVGTWSNSGELQPVYVNLFNRLLAATTLAVAAGFALVILSTRSKPAAWVARTLTSKTLLLPLSLAGSVFFLTSPFVILDFPAFVQGFFFPIAKQVVGGLNSFTPDSPTYQVLSQSLPRGDPFFYLRALYGDWGPLTLLLVLIGAGTLARRFRAVALSLVALVGVVLLATAGGNYQATRYIYSIWGVLALLGGIGADYVLGLLGRINGITRQVTAGLLGLLLLIPLVIGAWDRNQAFFIMPDTRQQALNWIEARVPAGTHILREWGTPELELARSGYAVDAVPSLFENRTLSEWQARGVSLIVVNDFPPELYLQHPDVFAGPLAEYDKLKRDWNLVAAFPPGPGLKGAPVYVYAAPGR